MRKGEINISDQIALVTGASRGIGRAVAVALAETGRHVVVNYMSREKDAAETLEAVQTAGGSGELLPFDVAEQAAAEGAVNKIIEKHGRIDVLVNNAGIRDDMLLVWMEKENWQNVIDTNLTGFYNVSRLVVKSMLLNRFGRIVNITSTSGQSGMAGQVNYSASKAGLIGATRSLAKEVAKRGVTVNAVSPGFIETEMIDGVPMDEIAKSIPANKIGRPEDVTGAVLYFCSPGASYVTGQLIGVNGGIYP